MPYTLVKDIAKNYGYGFCHCMYNPRDILLHGKKVALAKGERMIFLVEDKIPEEFRDCVALHERGEELSLGNHFFASKLEFGYAQQKKQITKYIDRIEKNFPSKFVDVAEEVVFPILPQELQEYLVQQGRDEAKTKELEQAQKIIEEHPLSNQVSRRIKEYSRNTNSVCNIIEGIIPKIQSNLIDILSKTTSPEKHIQQVAQYLNKEIGNALKGTFIKDFSALSQPRVRAALDHLEKVAFRGIREKLPSKIILESNTFKLLQKAKNNQPVVTIEYTAEDQARLNPL